MQGNLGTPSEYLNQHTYQKLKAIARRLLARERDGHTFSTTDLVHTSIRRMLGKPREAFRDRDHFMWSVVQAMNWRLKDHGRARLARKRDPRKAGPLPEAGHVFQPDLELLLTIQSGLERLGSRDREIVELHASADLTMEECARRLGISSRQAKRRWQYAARRLRHHLRHTACG